MTAPANGPHNLARFIAAQTAVYPQALAELRAGNKQSHWTWFVLPQVLGLGTSAMSRRYGVRSLAEAQAYLAHPVLGARLRECVAAMNTQVGLDACDILGEVDARKFQSCLTLFLAAGGGSVFDNALNKYFAGQANAATLTLLVAQPPTPGER